MAQRQGRRPGENEGRIWSQAATNQEMPEATRREKKKQNKTKKEAFSPRAFKGNMVLLTPSFQTSALCEIINFPLF